jgi:hypothetical protein
MRHVLSALVNQGQRVSISRYLLLGSILGRNPPFHQSFDSCTRRADPLNSVRRLHRFHDGMPSKRLQSLGGLLGKQFLLTAVRTDCAGGGEVFGIEGQAGEVFRT